MHTELDPRIRIVVAFATAWCLATLAFVLVWCAATGRTLAGPYAGLFGGDQFRYLAWIREAGNHGLIADPSRSGAPHVYLQPMFLLSGLLWRAGLSLQLAYLLWTPVALGTLIWGYVRLIARFLGDGRQRAAALALALLFFSPLVPLMDYSGIVNADGANYLVIAAGHTAPYWQAWGFLPTVIALGLLPVVLLELVDGRGTRWAAAGTLVVAWLHPWGGVELVLVAAVLLARGGDRRRLGSIAGAGVLPLVYYGVLARIDPAWSLGSLRAGLTGPVWPLLFTLAPLALVALPALRRPRGPVEPVLTLWLGAAALTWLILPNSRDAALEGVSLPLAVLAVRGWRRLGWPRRWAWVALALAIAPGAAYSGDTFRDIFRSHDFPFGLKPGEQRTVEALAHLRGPVRTTPYLAPVLPTLGVSGDRVSVGPR